MIITISEARVSNDRWNDLEQAFREKIRQAPKQLKEIFLLHDTGNARVWRIVAVWRTKEAFEDACKTGEHETCSEIFNSIGIEPTRRTFEVPLRHEHV